MLSVNHITLVGTVQGAPITKKRRGRVETRLLLAWRAGDDVADLIDVVTYGDLAVSTAAISAGTAAYVEGRLGSRTVPLARGRTVYTVEVVADNVQTL